ncbi:sensor histidine kinase, partial [Nocardiopsis sp. TNDT3]
VVLVVGGAWAAGFAVRSHRARGRRRAERALTEERLRIARDLHDVVSHNLGLIAVRAGVAAHVAEADPREARVALRDIEEASRSALTEMRRALGVLRTEQAPLAPAPGLDGLDGLARDARRAGVDVRLTVRGMRGVPEGTRLMAYRIVQEALTNAVRHAAPTRCEVTVASDGAAVDIEVVDEGPAEGSRRPPGGPTGGHGLLGMRERAMMCGGAFTAGPRPQGGFAVAVRLPTGQESTP